MTKEFSIVKVTGGDSETPQKEVGINYLNPEK